MKKIPFFTYLLIFLLIIVSVFIGIFFIKNTVFGKKFISPISPLPNFLNVFTNQQVTTLNIWKPSEMIEVNSGTKNKIPEVSAKSALVYDLTNKKYLYAKSYKQRLPIASLTKIMTAIIALEQKKADNRYSVSKKALVGENSMGLEEDETLSLEELLYGLMLVSGNDAAEVLADNYYQGRLKFIEAMNKKAESLGLENTHFTNPSGLEGEGNQYSTANDLLVVTNYALSNFPLFGKIVGTYERIIPQTSNHKAYYLYNETNLLTSYPGVKGVKDGYTSEAGFCLVTYLEYKDYRFVGIILGSNNRRQEMKELLDYSLKSLGVTPPQRQ